MRERASAWTSHGESRSVDGVRHVCSNDNNSKNVVCSDDGSKISEMENRQQQVRYLCFSRALHAHFSSRIPGSSSPPRTVPVWCVVHPSRRLLRLRWRDGRTKWIYTQSGFRHNITPYEMWTTCCKQNLPSISSTGTLILISTAARLGIQLAHL